MIHEALAIELDDRERRVRVGLGADDDNLRQLNGLRSDCVEDILELVNYRN